MNEAGLLLRAARPVLLSVMLVALAGGALAAEAAKTPAAVPAAKDAPAAAKDAAATPDPYANPALAGFLKTGAKAYYLGQQSGMNGWLLMKNGQIQAGYAPPDNSEIIIGAMFGSDGISITVAQLSKLMETNPEISEVLKGALGAGATAAAQQTPVAHPDSPGEKLLKDMTEAATISLGNPAAPQVMMVMDTNCKHCRASWELLRDYVVKGIIQLRMLPVANMDSESERSAAVLLKSPDPLNAWNKYTTGDRSMLAGAAAPDAVTALRANHALVDRWKIDSTPYFVYRDKNGQVKIIKGEIEKIQTLLTDVVP